MRKAVPVLVITALLALLVAGIAFCTAERGMVFRQNVSLSPTMESHLVSDNCVLDALVSVTNHANNAFPIEVAVVKENDGQIGANQVIAPGTEGVWKLSGEYSVRAKSVGDEGVAIVAVSNRLAPTGRNIWLGIALFIVVDLVCVIIYHTLISRKIKRVV